jgi:hypothetical protein
MSGDWGPWIEHDGARPTVWECRGRDLWVRVAYEGLRPGVGDTVSPSYPGFYWRWRRVRVGWFRSEWRRVCDDPAYAPIVRYRFSRPPGQEALKRLHQIARGVRPVEGPEGPVRLPEVVE